MTHHQRYKSSRVFGHKLLSFHESGDGFDGIEIFRNDVLVGDLKLKSVFQEGDEFKNATKQRARAIWRLEDRRMARLTRLY